ncbi:unnamed protein product [Rotaria sp. Silwood1]|nr:unnamed protein product [Rotaria sp. Silwood1]CAF3438650.1 unnamed protein product [Rotaria sp. Silwood1]CAF4723936.1 unnamed protein product [Rotaria sp. Silwood1]CAF4895094.1 unnamed protein product [Rotaria sp. Silwood1]
MPVKVRKILEQVGDNPVVKIQLGRTPVEAVLILFLNILSSWKFANKKIELGYDEIYHNYLLITIQNEKKLNVLQRMVEASKRTVGSIVYKLEKAHRVRLMKPVFPTEFVDVFDIPLTPNKTFTLNRLITTASNIDKHFYTYDAANNNMCQTFVENIVDINGLTSNIIENTTRIALKPQDAKALVATLGSRSDIVKHITDLGGTVDKWIFDHKIKWKKPLVKEFVLIGNMHVKAKNDITNSNTDNITNSTIVDIQRSSDNTTVINGMTDTVIENADDAFNAVVALEEDEKKEKRNQLIIIIFSVLLVILLCVGAIIFIFFIWQNRKNELMEKESTGDVQDKPKSESSSSVVTYVNGNEKKY